MIPSIAEAKERKLTRPSLCDVTYTLSDVLSDLLGVKCDALEYTVVVKPPFFKRIELTAAV